VTTDEIFNAFEAGHMVAYGGVAYPHIKELIFYKNKKGVQLAAILQSKHRDATLRVSAELVKPCRKEDLAAMLAEPSEQGRLGKAVV